MKVHTAKTIAVPFESWFFLKEEQHRQRSETGKRLDKRDGGPCSTAMLFGHAL